MPGMSRHLPLDPDDRKVDVGKIDASMLEEILVPHLLLLV